MDLGSVWTGARQVYPVLVAVGLALGIAVLVISLFRRADAPGDVARDDRYPRPLDRSRKRIIGGVCSGIARYFGWDTVTTRAGFVVLALLTSGFAAVFAYLVLWRVMPLEPESVGALSLEDFRVD